MFVALVGFVHRAALTIDGQRAHLEGSIAELREALAVNTELHARLRAAAGRTATLNERMLHRVSADLHDGPAQNLSLALLRVHELAGVASDGGETVARITRALESALGEIRRIAKGLRIPSMNELSAMEAPERASEEFEQTTGQPVSVEGPVDASHPSEPVNIAIFRVVQESLMNSFKHAGEASRSVHVEQDATTIIVRVRDDGSGFNT